MGTAQVKSRKRVTDYGEVFTAEREVKAMCDLVKDETERIDSRVLEPACGNGNFLAEILNRKLVTVSSFYNKNPSEWEKYSVIALSSLYGVDIQSDNVTECRDRLFSIWREAHDKAVGTDAMPGVEESVRFILECNILCGDALTLLKLDGSPISFAEWNVIAGTLLKRRDYELATLLSMQENGSQGDLFLSSEDFDEEIGAFIPKPIREFKPIEYWRVQCQK